MEQKSSSHIITDEAILSPYFCGKNQGAFADRLAAFIKHQCATWPELKEAREYLQQSLTKKIFLSHLDFYLQHNPHRMKSSSAPVDREFIEKRPCFLCLARLYENQKALLYRKEWLILNNPYPIFPDHLVISHTSHLPQEIHSCLPAMLDFVKELDFSFTAFYNGPACGASAPDHLHFQACPDGGIPITGQLAELLKNQGSLFTRLDNNKDGACFTGELDSRALFMCIAEDRDFLFDMLTRALKFLKEDTRSAEEPMINLLIAGLKAAPSSQPFSVKGAGVSPPSKGRGLRGGGTKHKLMGIIFPRKAHRPACYFKKNEELLLVSPGAVDIGGLIILPRKEDFERMNRELLRGILSEVCCRKEIFRFTLS